MEFQLRPALEPKNLSTNTRKRTQTIQAFVQARMGSQAFYGSEFLLLTNDLHAAPDHSLKGRPGIFKRKTPGHGPNNPA